MSLKETLAEFDASRKRPAEVVAIIRRGIDYARVSGAAGGRCRDPENREGLMGRCGGGILV